MSEDDCYFSEHSNLLPPETPASSSNDYTYDNEQLEEEYIYDYELQQNEYIIYEEPVEEISYIIPRPTKKIIWKRPTKASDDGQASTSRKRKAVEVIEQPPVLEFHGTENITEGDQQQPPPPKKTSPQITDKKFVNFYLKDIRKRSETFKPKKPNEAGNDIFERLEQAGNCDIRLRQCIHPTCNRQFSSVQILAYHISYAHQQYNNTGKKNDASQICLVCGTKFATGQGKLSHMTSAHKDLAKEHARICLLQRPNTIVF